MEALIWRRAHALDVDDDLVHLGADSERGLTVSLCGVAIESVDADPKVAPSCPRCRAIAGT